MPSPTSPDRAHVARRVVAALLSIAVVAALMVTTVAPVAAHERSHLPTRIELPDGFNPEGIESWGKWLFAGSLVDGDIYRANAVTGKGKVFIEGPGLPAVGLHLDRLGRLWVAGGDGQQIRVYSAFSGRLLRTYPFPGVGFINDLDIVDGKVFATDSNNQQLLVIPLKRGWKLPPPSAARTMPLTGDIKYDTGFNANGIAKSRGWPIADWGDAGA